MESMRDFWAHVEARKEFHLSSSYWTEKFNLSAESRISPCFTWFTLLNETPPRRNIRCGERNREKPKHLRQKHIQLYIDIAGNAGNSVHYHNFAQEFVPMKRSQESFSLNFFPQGEGKHMLSRLAAQRSQVRTWEERSMNSECGSDQRTSRIERFVCCRRLWRSVSQRRMPRETEKHKQKIFHPKQCWFQMKRRKWKRNERRS